MNLKHLFYLYACLFSALAAATMVWQGRFYVTLGQILIAAALCSFAGFANLLSRARQSVTARSFRRGLVASGLAVYLSAIAALFFFQDIFLFVPIRGRFENCAAASRLGYEPLQTQFKGAAIRVLLKRQSTESGWMVVFHGNSESACDTILGFDGIFSKLPLNIAVAEYPGYQEPGVASTQALLTQNALAAFDFVQSLNPSGLPVFTLGRSLGTGVATFVASERDTKGLILISPYPSITEVAEHQYPFAPVRWITRNPFPARDWATHVQAPVLIAHGLADRVIPIELGRLESKQFPKLEQMLELPGENHGSLIRAARTLTEIQNFVSKRIETRKR